MEKNFYGIKIKEARKIKSKELHSKYTGEMLANELKISRSYLGDLETGRKSPSFDILDRIEKACNLPGGFFENENEIKNNPSSIQIFESFTSQLISRLIQQGKIDENGDMDDDTLDIIKDSIKMDAKLNKNTKKDAK